MQLSEIFKAYIKQPLKVEEFNFNPDRASAPGETIKDVMQERKLGYTALKVALQLSYDEFDKLLAGELKIDVALSKRLADNLGATSNFWLQREAAYRKQLEKLGK